MAKIAFSVPPEPKWVDGITMPGWKPNIHIELSEMNLTESLELFNPLMKPAWISGEARPDENKFTAHCSSIDDAAKFVYYLFEQHILSPNIRQTTMLELDKTCREFLRKTAPARTT